MKRREGLLCGILCCGFLDLRIIDDCRYDMTQICNDLKESHKDISLNAVIEEIFRLGVLELEEMVSILKEDTEIRLKRVSKGSKLERLLNSKWMRLKASVQKMMLYGIQTSWTQILDSSRMRVYTENIFLEKFLKSRMTFGLNFKESDCACYF